MEWQLAQAQTKRTTQTRDMEARIEAIETLLQDRERRYAAQELVWRDREQELLDQIHQLTVTHQPETLGPWLCCVSGSHCC